MQFPVKSKIGKEDIQWYDGVNTTFVRRTSTGGKITMTRVREFRRDEIYPQQYGAVGDGVTDDTAALQDAFAAAAGKVLYIPPGIYLCSTDLDIPGNDTKISGVRGGTILRFTGATDGLVLPDIAGILHRVVIEGLVLDTTSATAGKAIVAEFPTNAGFENVLRDITITNSGSGVWDYGLSTNNWQSSEVYSLRIYQSADCPVKIANASNELRFYGLEITGHATSTIGIDITGGGSAEDAVFFGGTIQGTLAQACIRINNAKPQFYGFHLENSDATPSLGGDVVFTGSGSGASAFHGFRGGSFYVANGVTVISAMISDSETNDITWGTSCYGCVVIGCRIGTYTDGGQQNKLIGCTGAAGVALQNSFTGGFNNFSAADATPSVLAGDCWYTNNVAPTTITMFDDGIPGQRVVIVFQDGGGANTTIDFTGTHLKGNAGVDWSPAFQDWMECIFDGTDWFCSVHDCTA